MGGPSWYHVWPVGLHVYMWHVRKCFLNWYGAFGSHIMWYRDLFDVLWVSFHVIYEYNHPAHT
jgi:hypothetical protein